MNRAYRDQLRNEFDRQVDTLLQKGYPDIAGMTANRFTEQILPLRLRIDALATLDPKEGNRHIPFVIVIKNEMVPAESAMPLVVVKGNGGFVDMHPVESNSFRPISSLQVPDGAAYLLVDIDTGQGTLNVTPYEALKTLQREARSPLTIDEGVALVTHFPQVLEDRMDFNCFSMLGSRRDDQRVPAMWISSKRARLGWCWDNNPHSWLGSASCDRRIES